MTDSIKTIDGYLAILPDAKRAALEKLRHAIKSTATGAEEVISYGMPAFKYQGKMLVGFAAFTINCGFYPWNGHTVNQFADELKGFVTSKGAIRFTPEKQLPVSLVKKIVRARMKENLGNKVVK